MNQNHRWNVALFFLMCLTIPARTTASVIQTITDSADTLCMEWKLNSWNVQTVDSGGISRSRIIFPEANIDAIFPSGELAPCFAVWVGMPSDDTGSMDLAAYEVQTIHLEHPLLRPSDDSASLSWRNTDGWTRIAKKGIFRGLHAQQVVIKPFDYDSATMTLRVLIRARLTIAFRPTTALVSPKPDSSEYEQMVRNLIINYPTAVQWRKVLLQAAAKTRAAGSRLEQRCLRFRVGQGSDILNEGAADANGLVRIPGSSIRQLGSTIAIDSVALYASVKGEMPQVTPDPRDIPDGLIEIPVIRFDADNDGVVDDEDYLLAYVTGASDWQFDPIGQYNFRLNHYDKYRNYWVTVNSASAATMAAAVPPAGIPSKGLTTFTDHQLYKRSALRPLKSEGGCDWIWKRLRPDSSAFEYPLDLTRADTTLPLSIRIHYNDFYWSHGPISITLGSEIFCTNCFDDSWNTVNRFRGLPASILKVQLQSNPGGGGLIDLIDFEMKYSKNMDMNGINTLAIFSPETSAVVTYQVRNIPPAGITVIRIPVDEKRISVVNQTLQGNTCSWSDSSGAGTRYFVCTQAGIKTIDSIMLESPTSRTGLVINDLRSSLNKSNYLIITDTLFLKQATALAQHKALYGRIAGCMPRIVLMDDVYREFSGGNTDPAALRNFLAYAFAHWQGGLEYVVFLGNGHYDYKHVKSSSPVFIPVFETSESASRCIEGFFAALDSGETYSGQADIFLGRLPCSTPLEADAVVEKIKDMEDPARADFSAWRNRVLIVADDDMQGPSQDMLGIEHTRTSEMLAASVLTLAPWTDLRKVYSFEYKTSQLLQKPLARQSILAELNNGVGYACYTGHGHWYQWADEKILTSSDIATLHNYLRYPVVMSFACTVGPFDWPDSLLLGTTLVTTPNAGAIASIASTRVSYANTNEMLSKAYFKYQFDPDAGLSIGQAYTRAMSECSNNPQYALLGDPSIRMSPRSGNITLSIQDSSGLAIDTLKSCTAVIIKGTVHPFRDSSAVQTDSSFGSIATPATVVISLVPRPDSSFRKDGDSSRPAPPYVLPSPPVFVATVPVVNGQFSATIQLPLRLPRHTDSLVLTAYAWHSGRLAMGVDSGYSIVNAGNRTISDSTGPTVAARAVYNDSGVNLGTSLTGAFVLPLPATIVLAINDVSGLDLASSAPDSGISVEIPGFVQRTNINHLVRLGETNKEALALFRLDGKIGATACYKLVVHAADLFGNVSCDTFRLFVTTKDQTDLVLAKVLKNQEALMPSPERSISLPTTIGQLQNSPPVRFNLNSGFEPTAYLSTGSLYSTSKNPAPSMIADNQTDRLFLSDIQGTLAGDTMLPAAGSLPVTCVYASSFTPHNYPSNAIDNDPRTRWTPATDSQSLTLDLGTHRIIQDVHISYYVATNQKRLISVNISMAAGKTGTIIQCSISDKGFGNKEITIPNVKGRFVTLTFYSVPGLATPNIFETKVFGTIN